MTDSSVIFILLYSTVQGITEFIPVSSSGHLNIIEYLFKNSEERNMLYETTAHISTTLALILYLLSHSQDSLKSLFMNNYKLIGISVIPAVLLGFLFKIFNVNFFSLKIIAIASIIGAVMLLSADKFNKLKISIKSPVMEFFIAGLFQCLAFIPGFSRSGSCITAFLILGKKKDEAIISSILMSFPIIILSFVSNLKDLENIKINIDLIFIFIISFLSAYFTLVFFIKYINKIGFTPYVIYRIFLGSVILYYLN